MRLRSIATLCLMLAASSSAMAGTYDALCGDIECQIDISARGISSPSGFTPSGLVAQWAVGSASDFNSGKAVAGGLGGATAGLVGGAILLGPIGALAGLIGGGFAGAGSGKEFEGYFVVVGYNQKGQKISHSFYFINEKPVKRLLSELPLITGLAQREVREIGEIEEAFASGNMQIRSNDGLPSQLGGGGLLRPASPAKLEKPITRHSPIKIGETENLTPPSGPIQRKKDAPNVRRECENGKPKVLTDLGRVCLEDLSDIERKKLGKGRPRRPG